MEFQHSSDQPNDDDDDDHHHHDNAAKLNIGCLEVSSRRKNYGERYKLL